METRDGDSFASFWPPTWSKCQRCLRHGPARTATFPWEKIGKNHTGITTNLQKVKPQYCDWILMSKKFKIHDQSRFFFSFKTFWGRKSIFHRTLWQNLWIWFNVIYWFFLNLLPILVCVSWHRFFKGKTPYSISKVGMTVLTHGLANELKDTGLSTDFSVLKTFKQIFDVSSFDCVCIFFY